MSNRLGQRQVRCRPAEFRAEQREDGKYIEGYFAVFGSDYVINELMSEEIDAHAFDEAIDDDIRCLTDHDTRLVLGRTSAQTFTLKIDDRGLFGSVLINPNDIDALNTYARVERGDVSQASFGFDILDEETVRRENGETHWIVKKVKLYECSVVTFPAYMDTDLQARQSDLEQIKKRELEAWKLEQKERLNHGVTSIDEA